MGGNMKDWKLVHLRDICKLINGKAYKQEELLNEGKYPVLRVGNFFSNRSWYYSDLELDDSKYCDNGDLLYAWSASFGPRIWQGYKVIYHYHIWKVELDPIKVHKRFLYYWFEWDTEQIKATQGVGTTMIHVTKGAMEDRNLYIPSLPEQNRIIAIVDEAFESIDIAIENTKKNLTNARELFESYLNAIFINKGDDWQEKTLDDICSITSKLVDPRQLEFLDLPHVGAGNMVYLTGELIDVKTAREEELISGKFLFDEKMVLYSKIRPYLMKACRPEFKGLCSADVYPLIPNDGQLDRDFLFHILMSRNFTNYAIAGSDRAGMPKVNRDHLFRYSVWIPSIPEQMRLAREIDEIAVETQRLEAIYQEKLTALTELKQSILQKAFTGELTADSTNQTTKKAKEVIAA
jgi:type I restriction enzyme, S subunit